ncbi:MAG: tetratricopeptide repeat protein [candidate division NC10 bacterium]|nr:tetratricopeptide repeat protein [candidate division NC10 bacterium]
MKRVEDVIVNSNNLGEVLLRLGLLQEAKMNLLTALGGAITIPDKKFEATVRTNLGSVYVQERSYNEALSEWGQAYKLFNKVRNKEKAIELMAAISGLRRMLAGGQEGEFKMREDFFNAGED